MSPRTRSPLRALDARLVGILLALSATPATLLLLGCDPVVFASSSTVNVMARASPAVARLRDPYVAGQAFPGSLQQMEGLLGVIPDDMTLRAMAARAYASYGFGVLQNEWEEAEYRGHDEAVLEDWRVRTSRVFLRSRDHAWYAMNRLHPAEGGVDGVRRRGLPAFTEYLAQFTNPADVEYIFWGAYAWAQWIGSNRDNMDAIADIAFVNAMVDRANELNPDYMGGSPQALRAGLQASMPAQLGGQPEAAKETLLRLIEQSGRRNLLLLVTLARGCAVPLQDRQLYQSTLEEVLNADPAIDPDNVLANVFAQQRAARYLAQIDELFDPPAEGGEESE